MPKEEWGVKRVCPTTGKRFYDMNRSPVVSPYTGEVVSVDTGGKTRILVADKDDIDAKKDDKVEDDLLLVLVSGGGSSLLSSATCRFTCEGTSDPSARRCRQTG